MSRTTTLRLWPGVVLVLIQWALWLGAGRVAPGSTAAGIAAIVGGWVGALAVLVWWVFFSRAAAIERWGGLALIVLGTLLMPALLDSSIAEGNVGLQYYLYMPPLLCLLLVATAAATRSLGDTPRRAALVAAILLGTGGLALMRSNGLHSDGSAMLAFRWAPTAEDRLLAAAGDFVEPAAEATDVPAVPSADAPGVLWPGFRGPDRRATLPGVEIETDWEASPPREMWRRPVGPGTSSFAVAGELLFTQEQRGDEEVVSAYALATGEPVWQHGDRVRVEDPYVGAGPRATPAVAHGRVYALGATGILNALDARDGSVVWSRDAAADAAATQPGWGFVSSPLVVDELVLVYVDELVAYDAATGERRWHGPDTGQSYGSPELVELAGQEQIVMATNRGAIGVAPADGALLWEHEWPGIGIVQPALLGAGGGADADVLIGMIDSMAMPIGSRRIAVRGGDAGWSTEERWTSIRLKTSFSSPVIHEGHAYGFDGGIMACIDVEAGERAWKGGRYGQGQLILLPDQDLLLVLTEQGEIALVSATPDAFREIARVPAIEGKTWSHPALAGDVLLVRNGQEMAAFRLAMR